MENRLVIKRCMSCGATVKVLKDCECDGCGIKCCGEEMKEMLPNSVDAAFEKHIPNYEIIGNEMKVTVNHVMEDEHFIEWISLINNNKEITTNLRPGENAEIILPYIPGAVIYSYCNKHGLWKKEVK